MATLYATRLRADPAATYRSVDLGSRIGGASPHALIGLLYEDLLRELRLAAIATERRDFASRSTRSTKALAILFALEASLDFDKGRDVAATLSRFYRGARETITRASVDQDAALFRSVAANIEEVAASWRSIAG